MVFLCSCGGLIWENKVHVCGTIRCSCGGILFDGRGHCCGYNPDYSKPSTEYELWRGFRTSDEWMGSPNWGKQSPSLFNTKNQESSTLNTLAAIEEIKNLKQTGSFHDYCISFDFLLTKVILSENYATNLFVEGLKPEINWWVKFLGPKTLKETYEKAKNQVNLLDILDSNKKIKKVECQSFSETEIQFDESENGVMIQEPVDETIDEFDQTNGLGNIFEDEISKNESNNEVVDFKIQVEKVDVCYSLEGILVEINQETSKVIMVVVRPYNVKEISTTRNHSVWHRWKTKVMKKWVQNSSIIHVEDTNDEHCSYLIYLWQEHVAVFVHEGVGDLSLYIRLGQVLKGCKFFSINETIPKFGCWTSLYFFQLGRKESKVIDVLQKQSSLQSHYLYRKLQEQQHEATFGQSSNQLDYLLSSKFSYQQLLSLKYVVVDSPKVLLSSTSTPRHKRWGVVNQWLNQLQMLVVDYKRTFKDIDFKEWKLVTRAKNLKVSTTFTEIRLLIYSLTLYLHPDAASDATSREHSVIESSPKKVKKWKNSNLGWLTKIIIVGNEGAGAFVAALAQFSSILRLNQAMGLQVVMAAHITTISKDQLTKVLTELEVLTQVQVFKNCKPFWCFNCFSVLCFSQIQCSQFGFDTFD